MTTTVIKNALIIDGTGNLIENGSVKFSTEGILDVSQKELPADTIIDASGKVVIPGLIDSHVHLGMLGLDVDLKEAQSGALIVSQLNACLAHGITTVRTLGTKNNCDIHVRNLINSGTLKLPRVLASGRGISITGGHGWMMNHECDTPEEALRAAREQIKAGADVIKMFATGGMGTRGSIPNAPQLTETQMRVVCEEAERTGRLTSAHCTGLEGAQNAIRAGVRSIEHAQLDEETTLMMREHGTYYCPTIITRYNIINTKDPQFEWLRKKASPGDLERKERAIRLCRKHGVPICASTDAADGGLTKIGSSLADEIGLYVQYGLSNMEAVMTATKNGAEMCRIDDETGTIAIGKNADLVVLDGNLLEDISALKSVLMTIRNGEILYRKNPG